MATTEGGIQGGHDETFDWNCSHCEEANKFVEAIVFCVECGECYCEFCWNNHERFPALKGHTILGTSQQESWGNLKKKKAGQDECAIHDDQALSMYCGHHDVICCPVCASLDHRTCEGMLYIPKVAKGIAGSRELLDTASEIKDTVTYMKKIKTKKTRCRAEIEDYKCSILNGIEEQRREVNKAFDQLKAKAETEMSEIYDKKIQKLKDEIEICENVETSLMSENELLVSEKGLSEKQVFLNLKSCQKNLRKWKKDLPEDIMQTPNSKNLEITLNPELLKAVNAISMSLDTNNCTKTTNYEYIIKESYEADVRWDEDAESCRIVDMCSLSNGNILLADYSNQNLKELNSSFNVIAYCNLEDSPYGVCCINEGEAVVAMKNQTLAFISTTEELDVIKSVSLSHPCYGVTRHGERLYVSDGAKTVYVYCMACMPLASLDMYVTYFQCFQEARFIAINADGTRLHVTDRTSGLVTIDSDGNHVSTLTHPNLQSARGVCIDGRGSVFVSGINSHNVLQLDSLGGAVVGTVATPNEGLSIPGSVIFNKSSMIVTHLIKTGCDVLTVLHLQLK